MNTEKKSGIIKTLVGGLTLVSLLTAVCGCSGGGREAQGSERSTSKPDPKLIVAMNRFALDVYARLEEQSAEAQVGGNRMISPAGLVLALSMLRGGASGETAAEMEKAMHTGGISREKWEEGQNILVDRLRASDPSVHMKIAHSIWSEQGFKLNAAYVKQAANRYDAQVEPLDFRSPEAAAAINQWAADHTEGKITRVVDDPLPADAKLFLMNAMYFRGDWSKPFDKTLTADQTFRTAEGRKIQVPTMAASGRYDYLDADGFQALRLPYGKSGNFGMLFVLPDQDRSLKKILKAQLPHFGEWTKELSEKPGRIELPKFRMKNSVQLAEILREQGMSAVFDPLRADLSALSSEAGPGQLYVSSVKQDTYLDVNEEGTEAAAVTAIADAGAAPAAAAETFEMKLNRPFFYAITEQETGLILFMGEVGNPAES